MLSCPLAAFLSASERHDKLTVTALPAHQQVKDVLAAAHSHAHLPVGLSLRRSPHPTPWLDGPVMLRVLIAVVTVLLFAAWAAVVRWRRRP